MTQAKTHGRRRRKIITTASAAAIIAITLSTTLMLPTAIATIPDTYINNEWEPYQDEGILNDNAEDIEASLSSLGGRRNRLLDHRNSKYQEASDINSNKEEDAYMNNEIDYFIEEGILGEDTSEEDRQLAAAVGQRKKINKQLVGINNNKKKNIYKLSTDSRDDESSILSRNNPHHVSKKKKKVAADSNRVSATQNKRDKKDVSTKVSDVDNMTKKNQSLQKKKKAMVSRQKQKKKKIMSTGGGSNNKNKKKIGSSIKKKKGQNIGTSIKKKKKKFAATGNNWKKKENGWGSKSSKGKGGKGKWSRVRDGGGGGKGNDWISDIDIDYGDSSSSNDKWRNPAELCTCMKWDTINNWNKNDIGWYAAAASSGGSGKKSSSNSASNFEVDKDSNRELGWNNDGWERVCKTWECSPTLSPTLSP